MPVLTASLKNQVMKKIITIFFCTALFASGFAQTKQRDSDNRNRNENSSWKRVNKKVMNKIMTGITGMIQRTGDPRRIIIPAIRKGICRYKG
jgi:hypothetical protein